MIIALSLRAESWKTRYSIAAVAITLLWLLLDFSLLGEEPLFLGRPLLSPFYVLRSVAIAGSAFFLVLFPILRGRRAGRSPRVQKDPFTVSLWALGRIEWPGWLMPSGSLLLAAACFVLFLARPALFNYLAKEDKIVEVLSALLLFLSSGIFVILFFRSRNRTSQQSRLFSLALLLFAGVFLVMGMEEVSWFQRTLGFKTPQAFSGNLQREFNLHNFATDYVELAYYFSSFVFLIFLPFLNDQTDIFDGYPSLASLIPGRMVLFSSVSIVAYTYDTWNISLDQIAFFSTVFILICYLYQSLTTTDRQAPSPLLSASVLVALIVFQAGYIACGEHFLVNWDVTEYKELLIPLGFFIHSLNMAAKERNVIAPSVVWTSVGITLLMAALRLFQKYRA